MMTYHEDEVFYDEHLSHTCICGEEFVECRFEGCEFEELHIQNCRFIDCTFTKCCVANPVFEHCSMMGSRLIGCRLLSIHWESLASGFVTPIDSLEECQMKYNHFVGMNFPRFSFSGNDILDSLFADCNLSRSSFRGSRLEKTEFFRCDLTGANFEHADGYIVDISNCKLKGAVFSFPQVVSLLDGLGIKIK